MGKGMGENPSGSGWRRRRFLWKILGMPSLCGSAKIQMCLYNCVVPDSVIQLLSTFLPFSEASGWGGRQASRMRADNRERNK